MHRFDVIAIGCGPAGERAAIQAARAGKHVAVIERHSTVGGTAVNWGTIPSKTLRESALMVHRVRSNPEGFEMKIAENIGIAAFMHRKRAVVLRELELINKALDRYAVQMHQGHGRFVDPHTVELVGVDGRSRARISGDVIIICTGSRPNRPDDVPFDTEVVFDSDTILDIPRMPRSLIVLGAGVIGVEYTSIFSALGIQVSLVDTRDALLPYLDREIADHLERGLRGLGAVVTHDDHYTRIERVAGDPPYVRLTTHQGNVLEADALLYSVGRDGNTDKLGLENIGVTPNKRGLLEVNENYQLTQHPHIYAVGDVIGYPALASTSMEQGRQAVRHAFGIPGPRTGTKLLPFAIYSVPEVSYIGETEESLTASHTPYVAGRGLYALNPRGQILGISGGLLKLLFHAETRLLLGVHIVGGSASELIHTGQAFLQANATPERVLDSIFNYPTLSDLYRHAALDALRALHRRDANEDTDDPPTLEIDRADREPG